LPAIAELAVKRITAKAMSSVAFFIDVPSL
jgi:hypothetical protein